MRRRAEWAAVSRRALPRIAAAALAAPAIARGADILPTTIRYLLGASPGTTYDLYARVFAQAVSIARPAMRVTVEPQPRANGRIAARMLMEARPDGATIGTFETALVYAELLGDDGVAFETSRFSWIGSFNAEPRVLAASSRLGVTTLDALRALPDPIVVAAGSTASVSAREPLMLNDLLGTRLKPVAGFPGTKRNLAIVAGEVGAAVAAIEAIHPLVLSGDLRVLLRLGDTEVPAPYGAAPSLATLVGERRTSPVFAFFDAHARLGRWLCLPPDASPERLLAWRRLFAEVTGSEAFRRLAVSSGLAAMGITPSSGEAVAEALRTIFVDRRAMADAVRASIACGERIAETGARRC